MYAIYLISYIFGDKFFQRYDPIVSFSLYFNTQSCHHY